MEPNKRVLIFDDDLAIVSILRYIFEEKGWELNSSADCADVLSKVTLYQPAIIMMDNNIPPLGGVAASKSIKSQADLTDIPLIFFSASADVKVLAVKAGADAYLNKPFDLSTLYNLIERMLPGLSEEQSMAGQG